MATTGMAVSMAPRKTTTKAVCCEISCTPCPTGCKFVCTTDDKESCKTLQDFCSKLAENLCTVQCCCQGECCCDCRFVGCQVKCEKLTNGVCLTLTGCDSTCVERTQAMCEMISSCLTCGCECTLCLGTTTICCTPCKG